MQRFSALLRCAAFAACIFTIFAPFAVPAQSQTSTQKTKVVVISLDAFGAASLREPELPAPALHELMKRGVYAVAMQPINPTITWPNHTSLVTGDNASLHHVVVNGLIVNQRTATPLRVNPDAPKSKLVAVPTIYDVAHEAGLTTADVNWPAVNDVKTFDWKFLKRPDPDGPIERELIGQGVVSRDQLVQFDRPSQAWRDRIYTRAAVDIIQKHHPDLLLVHLLSLDHIEHETGYGNDAGRNTIAFLDDRVKEIVDAVRRAGDMDHTTFLIVSDHGQQSVHKHLHPNVLLKEAGLHGAAASNPVFCRTVGGYALLFQEHATEASREKLKTVFEGKEGVQSALTPEEAAKLGWPVPSQTGQAPDLLLYAADGYAFAGGNTGAFVTDAKETGAHGYLNTNPLMQAIFIAAGAGIQPKGQIAAFPNLDVAPTIARLLHISLKNVQGTPLTEILK